MSSLHCHLAVRTPSTALSFSRVNKTFLYVGKYISVKQLKGFLRLAAGKASVSLICVSIFEIMNSLKDTESEHAPWAAVTLRLPGMKQDRRGGLLQLLSQCS